MNSIFLCLPEIHAVINMSNIKSVNMQGSNLIISSINPENYQKEIFIPESCLQDVKRRIEEFCMRLG